MKVLSQGEPNGTRVMEFILLAFPGSRYLQTCIFMVLLITFLLTVFGNLAIIVLVVTNRHLHTPMYFFLCNLSFLEVWYTAAIAPKTLAILLGRSRSISFMGCLLQLYFVFSFGTTEYFLLSVMAFDRYLAISRPLHYHAILGINLSVKLAAGSWLCGFLAVSIVAFLISKLHFYGPNVINHFYCNIDSWVVLSCSDTTNVDMTVFVLAAFIFIGSCLFILLSYMYIISAILRIPSSQGKKKAFSTYSSHLLVVVIWYGSTIFLYVKPSRKISLEMTKIVNTLNTLVTPLLNPFIYTLRNKEVKETLRNSLHWRTSSKPVT